ATPPGPRPGRPHAGCRPPIGAGEPVGRPRAPTGGGAPAPRDRPVDEARTSITDVPGVLVGHATDLAAGTGCTVVLFEGHAIGGVDVGGGGASLRQADALRPGVRGGAVHGILLTGGSSFGHGAADGCLRFLEERGRGNAASVARVP